MIVISYFVTVASIIGTIANSFQKKWCFYVWIATNVFWVAYNLSLGSYSQVFLYVVNTITSIIGIIKWRDSAKKKEGAKANV